MSIVTRPRSEAEVDQIIASIRKVTKELTKDPAKAREFLIEHGYTSPRKVS